MEAYTTHIVGDAPNGLKIMFSDFFCYTTLFMCNKNHNQYHLCKSMLRNFPQMQEPNAEWTWI